MKPKQIFAFIVLLIVLLAIAVGISKLSTSTDEALVNDSMIENDFGSKVVYITDLGGIDINALRADCRERKGQFNECGSVCATDTEECTQACAYTCENIPVENGTTTAEVPAGWQTHTGTSFSIMHPSDMEINPAGTQGVNLSMWGPTQAPNTEFFDGISMTIFPLNSGNIESLGNFVQQRMQRPHVNSLESHPTKTTVDGREAWTFRAMGEIDLESTYVYVSGEENTVYEIVYSAPDPTGQGFRKTVETMLSTLEII